MLNEPNIIITRDLAKRVLEVIDVGLVHGMGYPIPGRMCVEAAVCYALGFEFGDNPQCVDPALRDLKIELNDSVWSSNMARAKGLRRLGIAQLGSRQNFDRCEFARNIQKLTRKILQPLVSRDVFDQFEAEILFRDVTPSNQVLPFQGAEYVIRSCGNKMSQVVLSCNADKVLSEYAEGVVQILVTMKAAGIQWLDLAPLEDAE